jgi:hypothetical protein
MMTLSVFPTFWERVKFLFCKRMELEGDGKVGSPMKVTFYYRNR